MSFARSCHQKLSADCPKILLISLVSSRESYCPKAGGEIRCKSCPLYFPRKFDLGQNKSEDFSTEEYRLIIDCVMNYVIHR